MASIENTINYQQEPVHDEACERLVVGTMLQNNLAYEENSDILSEECFENAKYRIVYEAIKGLTDSGGSADMLNIPEWIEQNEQGMKVSFDDLIELTKGCIMINFREKCLHLLELSKRRRLLLAGYKLISAGTSQATSFDEVMEQLNDTVEHINDTSVSAISSMEQALVELNKNIDTNKNGTENIFDFAGIRCLDERAFLRPQALTVVAAYSGHGKSCLATSIAYNCANTGTPIAYYSLEMSKMELSARIIAHVCKVPTSDLLYQKLSKKEGEEYIKASTRLLEMPIYFDERATVSADTMMMSIRQMVRQKHIKGVIIDYLQILSQNGKPKNITEEAFLGGVVRSLKNIAKQMNIWIILLSQISRNHESEEPKESYLRGSGQILEGCDNCVLLYRPSKTQGARYSGAHSNVNPIGTAELNVCKARNGSDGKRFIIGFKPEYTYFYDLEKIPTLEGSEMINIDHDDPEEKYTKREEKEGSMPF